MLVRLRAFFNPPTPNPLRAPARIFWTGFVVRVLYMMLAHTYRIRPAEDHFQFGWEAGRIARALVTGYGYADPFANAYLAHTGPTAWLPPLYPLLLAGIFKVFGVFTPASAWVLFVLQSACSAATALATWEIAARILNRRVALWSAWIWALYPAAMQYAVRWPWEMTITSTLFAFVLVLSLRMRGVGGDQLSVVSAQLSVVDSKPLSPQLRTDNRQLTTLSWLIFGLMWALIALANPSLLIFLPVNGIWILLPALRATMNVDRRTNNAQRGTDNVQHRTDNVAGRTANVRRNPAFLAGPLLAALLFVVILAPWSLRNERVFHSFIPLRGNFGAELYMGNGPGSNGLLMEYFHPFQDPKQLQLYAAMGEVRYVAMRGAAAEAIIAADPAHFVADCARRAWFFWASVPHPSDEAWFNEIGRTLNFGFISVAGIFGLALALRNRVPAAGLFAWAFVLLPVPYYMVTVHARFRHPLEPLITIFGVYLFQSAQRRTRREGTSPEP